MTYPFSETTLVRDIVNQLPKASDIFKRHRIDFCCGGAVPLKKAAAESKTDLRELTNELFALYEKERSGTENMEVWTDSGSEEIIRHIQTRYHEPHREELVQLTPYVTKVARVHGMNHPELIRVHELFLTLKKELLEHTKKEDERTFPLILKLAGGNGENKEEIINEIMELEKEHDITGDILKELRDVTSGYTLPPDACGTYRIVYKRLEKLEEETFMHIHLENNILFPRYLPS